MTKREIRKKYQRDDESDMRGTNSGAIDNLISMLELHKSSSDEYVKSIAEHFGEFEKLAPNFVIFESQNPNECCYMHKFAAFQIGRETEILISSHEFGHAVIGVTNDTEVPNGYAGVIERAKEHALSLENREYFREYITYLSQKDNQYITDAEKGPVSDIISSIFQQPGFRIRSYDNVCMLPACHSRNYYYDEEKKSVKVDKVYDENFANFYALKANNCEEELYVLGRIFGEELFQVLERELLKSAVILERVTAKEHKEKDLSALDNVKSVITGIRQEEIYSISEPENEITSRAANQLYEIILLLPDYSKYKIPISIMNSIETKKIDTEEINIKSIEHINDSALFDETKKYLSYIFLNYLANEDEKIEFNRILNENEARYQASLSEKYDTSNIFESKENKKDNIEINVDEDKQLVNVAPKSWWSKILEKIKSICKIQNKKQIV